MPIAIEELESFLPNLNEVAQQVRGLKTSGCDEPRTNFSINLGWHDNILRLVASYVSKGWNDGQIHSLTDEYTQPGYSIEQTQSDVQKMIDGARAKGFDQVSAFSSSLEKLPFTLKKNGEPHPNTYNIITVLRHRTDWLGVLECPHSVVHDKC